MKKVILLTFVSLLLPMVLFGIWFGSFVAANPIPIPTLMMASEVIDTTISSVDGMLWARVNGTYPFGAIGVDEVTMYYPVPSDADKISVKMNETSLDWSYSEKTYSTVMGDFPMIKWMIKPVPSYFLIITYYEHPVPLIDGNYTFLYAMGTGKYLGELYAKETTAYITTGISMDVAIEETLNINVYTIGYNSTTDEWIWKPARCTISQEDRTYKVKLTISSRPFNPLEEDFLLTFRKTPIKTVNVPEDYPTIEAAADAANPGNTILVAPGTYYEYFTIDKSLTLIGEDCNNTIICGSGTGPVIYVTTGNVEISGFTIQNGYVGIYLWEVTGNTISGNIISNVDRGVVLYMSDSNTITGNTLSNRINGVRLYGHSSNNTISDNTITNSHDAGIDLLDSESNMIKGNTITNNECSIRLSNSNGTIICHNNFINNTFPTDIEESFNNAWDDGYPSGGNYWSNYNGTDFCSGPDHDQLGSDGIGDTPYMIDADNQDRYPLMGSFTEFNVACEGQTLFVATISNSAISEFHFSQSDKLISFYVTEREETIGFCRVTIPKKLMWCDALEEWNVTVDGNTPTYLKAMEDTDYTYLYFTYSHTIHNVKITSTYVIGEILPPVEENIPFWIQRWFWAIVAVAAGIAVLAGGVYFLKKRKLPTAFPLSLEGTDTSIE